MRNILLSTDHPPSRKNFFRRLFIQSPWNWRRSHAGGLLLGLSLLLAGCLPVSLQPYYREADVRFDEALIGVWSGSNEKGEVKNSWTFGKGDKQSYELVIKEGTNTSPFVAHLFAIGEQRFLDLYPHEDGLKDVALESTYKVALIPGHLFLRVDQIEPSLKMSVMKIDWLKDYLKKNPKAIKHEWVSNDETPVLTAATEDLQAFLKARLGDPEAWDQTDEMSKMTGIGGEREK